jgi:hypothetical protein
MRLRRLLKRPDFSKAPRGANENVSPYAISLDLRPEPPSLGDRVLVWAGQLTALVLAAGLSFWAGTRYAPIPKAPAVATHRTASHTIRRQPTI